MFYPIFLLFVHVETLWLVHALLYLLFSDSSWCDLSEIEMYYKIYLGQWQNYCQMLLSFC